MHETQQDGITLAHLLEALEPDLKDLSNEHHQMLWDIVTFWKQKKWQPLNRNINIIFRNEVLKTSDHNKRLAVLREALNRLKDEAKKNLSTSSS